MCTPDRKYGDSEIHLSFKQLISGDTIHVPFFRHHQHYFQIDIPNLFNVHTLTIFTLTSIYLWHWHISTQSEIKTTLKNNISQTTPCNYECLCVVYIHIFVCVCMMMYQSVTDTSITAICIISLFGPQLSIIICGPALCFVSLSSVKVWIYKLQKSNEYQKNSAKWQMYRFIICGGE